MTSFSSLFLLLSVLYVLFSVVFGQSFPCPTPLPAGTKISAAEFSKLHPEYAVEWYYVTGNLCEVDDLSDIFSGCSTPIGFQLTQFLVNTTEAGFNLIAADAQLAISSNTRYAVSAQGLPVPGILNSFDLGFASLSVLFSFNLLYGTPGSAGAIYHFSAVSPNATIDLTLRAVSPLMYDGQGGYAPTVSEPGVCTSYYYLSAPHLQTMGTIILNGKLKFVRGTSWFDHQWGANPFALTNSGWIWIGLHIGSQSVLVFVPRLNQQNLYNESWITIQQIDGSESAATVLNVDVLNTWTSPDSGINYPIKLSIQTSSSSLSQLVIAPLWDNQESVANGLFYWEGEVSVTAQGASAAQTGNGYLELVGFV